MEDQNWIPIILMPGDGKYYLTAIKDENGIRNEAKLRRDGNLFFMPSGIYVYYTPTHFYNPI